MTVWSPRHDWSSPVLERWSYLTDAGPAEDGSEQRVQLRTIPQRQLQLAASAFGSPKQGRLDALVTAGQTEAWTVPYWPGATFLTADATAGSSVALAVEATADRGFVSGGIAVLYREGRTPEQVTVSGVTGTTVTVATLAANWPASTHVMPAYAGQWAEDARFGRPSTAVATMPATFDLTGITAPNVTTPTSVDLFDVALFTRRESPTDAAIRRVVRAESPTSSFVDYAEATTPQGQRHTAPLWLPDRATALALLTWFHGVKGRFAAFRLPTMQADLTPVSGLGTSSLTVTWVGYAARLFPLGTRSRLVAFSPDRSMTELTVSAAVDNGDGTETVTLSGTIPADTVHVSYALTVRLASDTLELRWLSTSVADTVLDVVEVAA